MRDCCGPVLEVPSRAHEVSRLSVATAEIAVVEEEDRQSPAREPPGESGQPERTFRGKAVAMTTTGGFSPSGRYSVAAHLVPWLVKSESISFISPGLCG